MSTSSGNFEGKYEVLGKLREGGMGAIYMVRHRLLDEVRIIKVMRPEVAESADQRKRFLREAQTATRLKHGNIVGFYDFFVDDEGTAYMVMEYIDGINLRDTIRNCGPLPIPLALHLARQALSALDYLHRKGIVHRDISPDNIMMLQEEDGTLHAKLIDLGIAKLARAEEQEQLTAADEFIGKLRYSSPEQLTKKASSDGIDGRSDLFSFAVVLYEAMTGVCPYAGGSLQEILTARLHKPPISFDVSDPMRRVPQGLRDVLLKALEKAPADRWQTATEFTKALDALPPDSVAARDPEEVSEYVERAIAVARKAALAQSSGSTSLQKNLQSKFRVSEVSIRPLEATDLHVQKTLMKWGGEGTPTPSSQSAPFPEANQKTVASGPRVLPQTPPPAPYPAPPPSRSPAVGYALVALGAAVLVVLGIVVANMMRERKRENSVQAVGATAPTAVALAPTALPATAAPIASSVSPTVPVPEPTAAPRVAEVVPPPRPTEREKKSAVREERVAVNREGSRRSSGQEQSTVPGNSNPNRPKVHFCADIGRTQFTQGATQEVPNGFGSTALKPARADAGRISLQIKMSPEEVIEGQDFTIAVRFLNGGDDTFRMQKAEESSPAVRGGFEPLPSLPMPQSIDIGGSIEIYRTSRSLAGGSTYRKAFRVFEQRRGDVWENAITVKPCLEQ